MRGGARTIGVQRGPPTRWENRGRTRQRDHGGAGATGCHPDPGPDVEDDPTSGSTIGNVTIGLATTPGSHGQEGTTLQLASPASPDPTVRDAATAIRDALQVIGQGPAVTVLLPSGRQEQGMASLAQWAAKGAHLIEADLLLEPGDRLALDAPLSWSSVAVCLAAWWAGVAVVLGGDGSDDDLDDVEVAVIHEDRLAGRPVPGDTLALGDAIDGAPQGDTSVEPWVRAVQAFPDHPPTPRATPELPALIAGGRTWTQAELLDTARSLPPGTIGVDATTITPWLGLVAAAVHPLVSGRPTVVLRDVDREVAAGDRVAHWIEHEPDAPTS